jgi:hypothetical protein
MNKKNTCEIHFGTLVAIAPGQLFQMVARGQLNNKYVPRDLIVSCSSHGLIINFLRVNGKDLLAAGSALPADTLGKTAFLLTQIEGKVEFSLGVTNISEVLQNITSVLVLERLETVVSPIGSLADDELHHILDEMKARPENLHLDGEDDDEKLGVLAKCWSWFKQGVTVAMVDRALATEERPTLGDIVRPARARDSLRRLVSDFVDAAEIPLLAAALYWKQVAEIARGSRTDTIRSTVGFGPETIAPHTKRRVIVKVAYPFKPRRLRLSGNTVHRLQIVDVLVGEDSILLSPSPVPGVFGEEGVDLCGDQIAFTNVTLVVVNDDGAESDISGILEGERMSFTSK